MKKTNLLLASALFTVLALANVAHAKTDMIAATATKAVAAETAMTKDDKPMRGMMMGKMSEAGQKIMKEAMDKMRAEHQAHRDQMKAKHDELSVIVKAATFDKAAYMAKKEEINLLHHQMMKAKAESMAAALAQLTPEDRAAFADMPRGPHHGGMKGKGMGMGPGMGMGMDCPMMDDKAAAPAKAQ